MKYLLKKIKIKLLNLLTKEEDIKSSKSKWDSFAGKEAEYVVWTQDGKGVSKENFRESGKKDYDYVVKSDLVLQDKLSSVKRDAALEIGCGVGRITEFLAGDFNKVYGVDISGNMIKQAKARLPQEKYHFFEGDGMHLPIDSESVDFIMSHAVFQHMPSREVVEANFREAFRVLKPGGLFKVQLRATETSRKNWFYGVHYSKNEADSLSSITGFSMIYNNLVDRSDYKKILYLLLQKPKA